MKPILKYITLIGLISLQSCGGSGGADNPIAGQDDTTTTPITTTPVSNTSLQLGTGAAGSFIKNAIQLSSSSITEGETTTVTVNIVDASNEPYIPSVPVNFSSLCTQENPATASFTISSVSSRGGIATTTYQDAGCQRSDQITATLDTGSSIEPSASGEVLINDMGIGSGEGQTFVTGTLALDLTSISSGGSTSVTANVVDQNNTLIDFPVSVTFGSNCATQGTALFDRTSVSTVNGVATVTYTANSGCSGLDSIRATIDPYNNNMRTAQSDISIAIPQAGAIQFTSTEHNAIALSGTGSSSSLQESTRLIFQVTDNVGQPLQGVTVNFTLNTAVGGISLSPALGTSDANGFVQTFVSSGTVSASVRVTAIVDATNLSTQSTAIVISTGLPHQRSISLSATELNPKAWNHDNKVVQITALLADRFNNPIQDNTNISFTTELGAIEASCSTIDGGCSVNWRSQAPRGAAGPGTNAGRTTILASVIGEESFVDNDGNGVYSELDGLLVNGAFEDIPEPYVDENEDGVRNTGAGTSEPFKDFNDNGIYDTPDLKFNGVACIHPSECGIARTTFVSKSIVLVMAEDNPAVVQVTGGSRAIPSTVITTPPTPPTIVDSPCDDTDIDTTNNCNLTTGTYPTLIDLSNGNKSITFTVVGHTNFQVMPVGTIIQFTTDNGKIVAGAKHTVNNTSANTYSVNGLPANLDVAQYTVVISPDTTSSNGNLSITVTTPDGGPVTAFIPIPVTD